jgi:acylglycerol lipase
MSLNTVPYPEELTITDSGANIFVRIWRPAMAPRAILVICHGVNSHGGQYGWTADQMTGKGFVVYALDLRGRGRSGGQRFHVERVEDYVADLAATVNLAKSRERGLPVYLLGHSAGGVVSSVYVLEHQSGLAGFICESFAFQVPTPDFVLGLVKGLSRLAPNIPVLRLKNEDFSRDPETVKRLNEDPLTHKEAQPAITVAALVRANERLEEDFYQIELPLLILHGTADKATMPSGSQFFKQEAGSRDKTLKLYQGHFHDLLADFGKEQVIADIQQWVDERLESKAAPKRAGQH